MTTAIGRGGMNQSLIDRMVSVLAAVGMGNNIHEFKAPPQRDVPDDKFIIKTPGMSPRDYAKYKAKSGHPRRKKNLASCARKAKLKRRCVM